MQPEKFMFTDVGEIPNNPLLPLLYYPSAVSVDPDEIEHLFAQNGWPPAWRYGVYPFPHYHSTAHEVLGIYRGEATLRLGHTTGQAFEVKPGDVIVIPAGVAHQNLSSSSDFHVVGAYPSNQSADLLRGRPGERPDADRAIESVPLPSSDPVYGSEGPLTQLWKKGTR